MIRLGRAEVIQDHVYEEIVLMPRNRKDDAEDTEGETKESWM